jgi:hypothetical protein
MRSARV